jgi:hypothetical protein
LERHVLADKPAVAFDNDDVLLYPRPAREKNAARTHHPAEHVDRAVVISAIAIAFVLTSFAHGMVG